eukprot:m.49550 g.49550  ORF g.49550 m.49550 type:complete len:497 (-) comp11102_c0_seq1:322-1812(-)
MDAQLVVNGAEHHKHQIFSSSALPPPALKHSSFGSSPSSSPVRIPSRHQLRQDTGFLPKKTVSFQLSEGAKDVFMDSVARSHPDTVQAAQQLVRKANQEFSRGSAANIDVASRAATRAISMLHSALGKEAVETQQAKLSLAKNLVSHKRLPQARPHLRDLWEAWKTVNTEDAWFACFHFGRCCIAAGARPESIEPLSTANDIAAVVFDVRNKNIYQTNIVFAQAVAALDAYQCTPTTIANALVSVTNYLGNDYVTISTANRMAALLVKASLYKMARQPTDEMTALSEYLELAHAHPEHTTDNTAQAAKRFQQLRQQPPRSRPMSRSSSTSPPGSDSEPQSTEHQHQHYTTTSRVTSPQRHQARNQPRSSHIERQTQSAASTPTCHSTGIGDINFDLALRKGVPTALQKCTADDLKHLIAEQNAVLQRMQAILLQKQEQELKEQMREASTCKVCMDQRANVALMPCRHATLCASCAHKVTQCPMCRQPVEDRIQLFL